MIEDMGRENKYETGKYYSRLLIKGCTKRKQIVDYKGPHWQWLLQLQLLMTRTVVVSLTHCAALQKKIFSLFSPKYTGKMAKPVKPGFGGFTASFVSLFYVCRKGRRHTSSKIYHSSFSHP